MKNKEIIREQFKGLSKKELSEKAYGFGFNFEKFSHSCSQSTVAAIHRLVKMDDVVVKVATSLCGGNSLNMLGACGGISGGIIALDYFFGRPVERMACQADLQADTDAVGEAASITGLLVDKYVQHFGSYLCCNIQRKLYGRFYWVRDEQESSKLVAAGAHEGPAKCNDVVGNAARWTMEILLDNLDKLKL
jgi:hypothetical protein